MSSEESKQKITYLGKIDHRDKQIPFGIKADDRTKHMYVIGKSGMGKSTLLENFIIQDINNGEGVCVIDPHGSLAEMVLHHIPESRIKDVVYFAPFDGEYPVGLNMLEKVPAEKRYLLANGMMSAFKKIFTDGDGKGTFSARMEYVLNNIILALLENEGQTLLGVNRMLFDKDYRKFIVSNVTDPTVRDFWVNEYANYTDKTAQDLAPAIQNKIGQFVSNPLIRNIIGQKKTSFDIRKIMDEKKIFIANLSKGKVGEGNANLLGSLLVTKIYLAAMSRADVDVYEAKNLPPCYFYVDEFQNFANESFASILSEARKYKLALIVAHQYIDQMTDEVRSAVFGNVGTMITFRVGATDAEVFEKEFAPKFVLDDFVNLSAHQIYLRLMIDSQGSVPFSARTLPPIQKPAHSFEQAVIAFSRATYGKQKFLVEEEILDFYKPAPKVEKPKPENETVDAKFLKVTEHRSERVDKIESVKGKDILKRFESPRRDFQERKPFDKPFQKDTNAVRVSDKQEKIFSPTEKAPYIQREQETKFTNTEKKEREHNNQARQVQAQEQARRDVSIKKEGLMQNEHDHVRQEKVIFDDKPAMSLKEALAKALEENQKASTPVKENIDLQDKKDTDVTVNKKEDTQTNHHSTKVKEEAKRKEISEDVLRKLIED